MIVRGEAIGAIIIQDLEKEHSFDDNDLRFVTAVANQISGALYTVRLLDESRRSALQFETAAEIARDISSSLELDELMQKAVNLIRSRFEFYHAGIYLKDLPGEFIVIREATGDAVSQWNAQVKNFICITYSSSNGKLFFSFINQEDRDAVSAQGHL